MTEREQALPCQAAEVLQVLCWLNTEVSTPEYVINSLIQYVTDLWGLISAMKIVLVSA